MNIFEMDGKTDFVVQLPLLNQDQLKRLTIRNVYAYWINKKRYAHAKKMYSTQFKFLRRFPLGPVVNDVPSVIRTLKNVQLFGRDGLKIGTISNVYPGYGLEPFKQNLAVLSAIQKGRIKHTTDRNTVEVIFSAHD